MTRQKELGYELGNVLWHNLEGYQELWDKAKFDTKEKIINELGELAIKLTTPDVGIMLPSIESKEFKGWLIDNGYTKTRQSTLYMKNDNGFAKDYLYQHYTNILTFGN